MESSEAQQIVSELRSIISEVAPDVTEKAMYGGTVFELDFVTPKILVCGFFVRKNHVTLELNGGKLLKDEGNLLKGAGDTRRHLTLEKVSDTKSPSIREFLRQAYDLSLAQSHRSTV